MFELIQATPTAFYFNCPAKIGLIRAGESEVCLIDSGNDSSAGKRALRAITENGWRLRAIYHTHAHADHIGGNRYLQAQTGCAAYARGIECDFTNHPILEPTLLYGGYPCRDLRHKFLLAEESVAMPLTDACLPEGVKVVLLPGHSFDMVGFRTADGAFYIGDALSSRETLDKYALCFLFDVGAYLETLEGLKTAKAKIFIPSHAAPTEDIAPLAQCNIDKVLEICEKILTLCRMPLCFDDLLQKIFDAYALRLTIEQYALVGSTLRAYLSYLKDSGKLQFVIEENKLYFLAT